jgi:hypothetical protein
MASNKDIAVLAKKIYELSVLSPAELESQKWQALLLLNAVYSAATPAGVAAATADRVARWGAQITAEGVLSALHPKWHLRTDDGKPPVARIALESALTNPHRDLRTRLAALQFIPPEERGPLDDLVRALAADAFSGAKGDARNRYLDVMRGLSTTWFKQPWLTVLPRQDDFPPLSILIENQGTTNDGGIYDADPSDDHLLGWDHAIRTWNVDFLRDNPLAQLYTSVESAASTAAETAGAVVGGANEAVKGIGLLLKWAPFALAGIGVVGLTALVFAAANRSPAVRPA